MGRKFKKYLAIMLTGCLLIGGNVSKAEAASNHLLIINSKKNKMGYYVDNKFVREYKVATGKSSTPTPQGKTKIVNKIKNRPYYSGGIPGGDPRNPLGDRWMGLNIGGSYGNVYGIHGNNNESSIGKHISGGCIRMHNKEVRDLFNKVPIGTDVIIKYSDDSYEKIAAKYNINLNELKPGWKLENNKWYYIKENKTYQKNGWLKISDKYYYFDSNGVMQTGWKEENSKWYYLNEDGTMRIGWKMIEGKWHYFNEDGTMRINWKMIDGKWYYFNEDGTMRINWKQIDGKWYYFNADGTMATNTTIEGWTIDGNGVATIK